MPSPPPITVLVVENHNMVRQGIVAILDYEDNMTVVAEAENGKEAIEQHAIHQPDITLMDLRMPQMNGLEAIIEIRKASPKANIVILTTYNTDEDIYQGLQAGARGYLLKDATAQELAQTVRQVHAGKRAIPADVALKLAERMNTDELTSRERDVLNLMMRHSSTADLAEALSVSEGTVKFHLNHIFQKLASMTETQAVIVALRRGLVHLE